MREDGSADLCLDLTSGGRSRIAAHRRGDPMIDLVRATRMEVLKLRRTLALWASIVSILVSLLVCGR